MGETTGIAWADATDNPIKTQEGGFYCEKVSPGCANCYAEVWNQKHGDGQKYTKRNDPNLYLDRTILANWAKKTKPKKRFVSSLTDVFGEFIPDQWVWEILDAMAAAPNQIFQVLTKRSERCYYLTVRWMRSGKLKQAPPNIWLGFSAEDQERLNGRWTNFLWLQREYNFIIWTSIEPMLGSVILPPQLLELQHHFWVVAGGESGDKARPSNPKWYRSLRDQCIASDVPFFFKQWGEWRPIRDLETTQENSRWYQFPDGQVMHRAGRDLAGRVLDGQVWSQFPGMWVIFQDVDKAGKLQGKLF